MANILKVKGHIRTITETVFLLNQKPAASSISTEDAQLAEMHHHWSPSPPTLFFSHVSTKEKVSIVLIFLQSILTTNPNFNKAVSGMLCATALKTLQEFPMFNSDMFRVLQHTHQMSLPCLPLLMITGLFKFSPKLCFSASFQMCIMCQECF